jgi:MFS superfamily sulfate permease-like transporter
MNNQNNNNNNNNAYDLDYDDDYIDEEEPDEVQKPIVGKYKKQQQLQMTKPTQIANNNNHSKNDNFYSNKQRTIVNVPVKTWLRYQNVDMFFKAYNNILQNLSDLIKADGKVFIEFNDSDESRMFTTLVAFENAVKSMLKRMINENAKASKEVSKILKSPNARVKNLAIQEANEIKGEEKYLKTLLRGFSPEQKVPAKNAGTKRPSSKYVDDDEADAEAEEEIDYDD